MMRSRFWWISTRDSGKCTVCRTAGKPHPGSTF